MKRSPLQLKWVSYPYASYEVVEDYEGMNDRPLAVTARAEVKWSIDGEHAAVLELSGSDEARENPYRFKVKVISVFSFDLDVALQEYRAQSGFKLPPVIAVNIIRILYAGAREYVGMMTSRSTYGAAILDSALFEPADVEISSFQEPRQILREVFKVSDEELAEIERQIASRQNAEVGSSDPTRRKKKPVAKHAES